MTTNHDAQRYNEYASLNADLSNAILHNNQQQVVSFIRTQRDIDNNQKRKFLISTGAVFPTELHSDILLRLYHPSKMAVFKQETNNQVVVEIWDQQHLQKRIILFKEQQLILNDPTFGGPQWNKQGTAIVYIGQIKPPKTSSFFHEPQPEENVIPGGQAQVGIGQFDGWGEKYTKINGLTKLFLLNIHTGKSVPIDNVPQNATLGQPIFVKDSVVYTAWDAPGAFGQMPRKLGLIYCQQRHSRLYQSSIKNLLSSLEKEESTDDDEKDGECQLLTPDERIARSPQLSPSGDTLVYLGSRKGFDTHSGCLELLSMKVTKDGLCDSSTRKVVIDTVHDPMTTNTTSICQDTVYGLPFPGIFTLALPDDCFVSNDTILLNTQWGSSAKVVKVSLSTGQVELVRCSDDDIPSESLLCVKDGAAIIHSRSFVQASRVYSVKLDNGDVNLLHELPPIAASRCGTVLTPSLDFDCTIEHVTDLPDIDGAPTSVPIQSILLTPRGIEAPPMIVVPHGGPHSASTTAYLPSYAFLCQSGYAILLVNYRGSTGFGQGWVESLPTRIGTLDVEDVLAATKAAMKKLGSTKVGICGGSHGGFLTAHLTSQYPDLFQAAAMRNPVVNLVSMTTSTDIPDWCFVEALGKYDWTDYRPPRQDELEIMFDKSPVKNIDKVTIPTLVALGKADLRVPYSQGLEWYHTLTARGVPTKLLRYNEDDHAIDQVASEADHWIHIKQWFDEHLKGESS